MNKISIIVILSAITLIIIAPICVSGQQMPAIKIGEIEFFGIGNPEMRTADSGSRNKSRNRNFTSEQLRELIRALPVKEGEEFRFESGDATLAAIKRAVRRTTGREATDVNFVCCDDRGEAMIFIGLPGPAYRPVQYNPAPARFQKRQKARDRASLPLEIVRLAERAGALASDAAQNEPREDRSKGYALSLYPPMREVQTRMREYALRNGPLLRRVVSTAANAKQSRAAAYALGYADLSDAQLVALAKAARDSDSAVRNDATRALGVLAQSNPGVAARIPAAGFVDMLSSGSWSDRNKSTFLLSVLTARRDPALLSLLRRLALEALIEMTRWRNTGHAHDARMILGRVAGIEETRLRKLASEGKVDEIIKAASRK